MEMLDCGLIDAALIAVPHYDHPRWAIECFNRGIHVMTEKPAGVYTRQVREMNEKASRSGLVFAIMFNQRSNPLFAKAREIVQSRQLGEPKRLVWIITDWYRTQSYYDSGCRISFAPPALLENTTTLPLRMMSRSTRNTGTGQPPRLSPPPGKPRGQTVWKYPAI